MTQKANRLPTAIDRLVEQSVHISNLYALGRVRLVPRSIEAASQGTAPVGGSVGGSGTFLPVGGGSMIGPLAIGSPEDFTIEISANNSINVGQSSENEQYSGNLQLDDIQPNSFVLDIIEGAAFHGQLLFLRTFAPTTPFTISQGTIANGGNVQTPNSADVPAGDLQEIIFQFDSSLLIHENTGGTWRLIGGTSGFGGGSGVSFPIDFPELDMGSPTVSASIDFTSSDRHFRAIILSDDLSIDLPNINATKGQLCTIYFTQDGAGGHVPVIPLLNNPEELQNIDTTPNSTTVFTIQAAFGTVLGFTSGKQIFFGTSVSDWSTFPAIQPVNFAGFAANNVGGLNMAGDIDVGTFDVINIDRLLFTPDSGGFASVNDIGLIADATGDLVYNVGSGDGHFTQIGKITQTTVTKVGFDTLFTIQSAENGGIPKLQMFALDPTPTIGTSTARIAFIAENNVSSFAEYAAITTEIAGITNGSEEGTLDLIAASGGNPVVFLSLNNNADDNITAFRNIAMDIGRNILLEGNDIFFDSSQDSKFSGTGTGIIATVNGTNMAIFNETAITLQSGVDLSNAHAVSFAPTSTVFVADDQMWVDVADGLLKFRENGVTKQVITDTTIPNEILQENSFVRVIDTGTGTVITHVDGVQRYSIQATRADYDEIPIFGMTELNLHESGGAASASIKAFSSTVMDIEFSGIPLARFESTFLQLLSGNPNTSEVLLNLYRNDATPADGDVISRINFQGNNDNVSPAIHDYVEIRAEILSKVDGSETGNFVVNVLDEGIPVDMFRVVSGEAILRKLTTSPTDGALLRLIKEDSTPGADDFISAVDYSVLDAGVETVYAQTRAEIRDVTDAGRLYLSVRADNSSSLVDAIEIIGDDNNALSFMNINSRISSDLIFGVESGSTDLVIAPSVNNLGFSVKSGLTSSNIGSLGSVVIPLSTSSEPANDAAADALFGSLTGSIGITRIVALTNAKFWVKADNGWQFVEMNDAF